MTYWLRFALFSFAVTQAASEWKTRNHALRKILYTTNSKQSQAGFWRVLGWYISDRCLPDMVSCFPAAPLCARFRPHPIERVCPPITRRREDAAVGPNRCPGVRGFRPLPLFDDLRVCLVYDFAHFRERLPAPVPEFLDLLVD